MKNLVVTARDDSFVIALDCSHMKVVCCDRKVFQLAIDKGRLAVKFNAYEQKVAVLKLAPVSCPVVGQGALFRQRPNLPDI